MRLNKFLAQYTDLSRRSADVAIENGRVFVNGERPRVGQEVSDRDTVTLDGSAITTAVKTITIMLNKPVGYVCSRASQGNKTIYELLPSEFHHLNPVGRLDKDSSGLMLLTNDGELANQLTHPRYQKTKIYEVKLNRELSTGDAIKISDTGIMLSDGLSKFGLEPHNSKGAWTVTMSEGRNRQIRRTFEALGYKIVSLHRTQFGEYLLADLPPGQTKPID